jgi:hypothetical protein
MRAAIQPHDVHAIMDRIERHIEVVGVPTQIKQGGVIEDAAGVTPQNIEGNFRVGFAGKFSEFTRC